MGRDKALLPHDGRLLLIRVAMRLRMARGVDDLVVACGTEDRIAPYAKALAAMHDVEVRFAVDRMPGLGPVAGLAAGLLAARHPYAAVAPVDAPTLEPAVVDRLFELADGRDGAVVERGGRLEVLWGVFARYTSGHFLAALAHGERAAHRAVEGLGLAILPEDELARLDPAGLHFRNLNAPHDV